LKNRPGAESSAPAPGLDPIGSKHLPWAQPNLVPQRPMVKRDIVFDLASACGSAFSRAVAAGSSLGTISSGTAARHARQPTGDGAVGATKCATDQATRGKRHDASSASAGVSVTRPWRWQLRSTTRRRRERRPDRTRRARVTPLCKAQIFFPATARVATSPSGDRRARRFGGSVRRRAVWRYAVCAFGKPGGGGC
jgi:hypothetical protein